MVTHILQHVHLWSLQYTDRSVDPNNESNKIISCPDSQRLTDNALLYVEDK